MQSPRHRYDRKLVYTHTHTHTLIHTHTNWYVNINIIQCYKLKGYRQAEKLDK